MALAQVEIVINSHGIHGKHGIFTDDFCVFRGFRGHRFLEYKNDIVK
jgi:hypothetical protein